MSRVSLVGIEILVAIGQAILALCDDRPMVKNVL